MHNFLRIVPMSPFLVLFLLMTSCTPQEKITEHYENGNPKTIEQRNSDGELLLIRRMHFNFVHASETAWENGQKHGVFRRWNSEGFLQESGSYKKGLKEGEWTEWFDRKRKKARGLYRFGEKTKIWLEWYPNGVLRSRKAWSKNKIAGRVETFFPNGKIWEFNTCQMQDTLRVLHIFFANGQKKSECGCTDNALNGHYSQWDSLGNLVITGNYLSGIPYGEWIWKDTAGNILKIRTWKDGVYHGLQASFSSEGDTLALSIFEKGSGKIRELCAGKKRVVCRDSSFYLGKLHGKITAYLPRQNYRVVEKWEKGQKLEELVFRGKILVSEGSFFNGKKHGLWKKFRKDGLPLEEHNYRNGKKWGLQVYFDSLGAVSLSRLYRGKSQKTLVKFGPMPNVDSIMGILQHSR